MADPYAANVVLHLPMNEYARDTSFLADGSPSHKLVAISGGANLSDTQSKFGGKSCAFNSSGDYLLVNDSADWDLTSPFAIELWCRITAHGSGNAALVCQQSGTSNGGFEFLALTNGALQFNSNNNTAAVFSAAGVLTTGVWMHLAVTWDGTTYRLFRDGAVIGTAASSVAPSNVAGPLRVGDYPIGNTSNLNGYIDDLRVTRGVARYTTTFTPPDAIEYTHWTFEATTVTNPLKVYSPYLTDAATFGTLPDVLTAIRDTVDGGTGKIVGTVKQKGTPTNLPLARKVRLHIQRDGRCIRETWSDAAGNYLFDYINRTETYYVTSFDHTGNYRGVTADNLTPEVM